MIPSSSLPVWQIRPPEPVSLLFDEQFQLTDSAGRTFSGDSKATPASSSHYNLDDVSTTVQPTFVIHTVVGFDVARDAHGLDLQNTDILGNNAQTLFKLGI
jgi:hypothetical protein